MGNKQKPLLENTHLQSHLFADLQHCNQRVDSTCAVSMDHEQTERPYDLILELVGHPSVYSNDRNSPYSRLEGFDIDILFPAWR